MIFREIIKEKVQSAFMQKGYDEKYGLVTVSNRPDLCQYQCNGCLSAAKQYRKKPLDIASEIAEVLKEDAAFASVDACPPGFLNITVSDGFLSDYINKMASDENMLYEPPMNDTVVIDYGGANVAKALHVGHLRSAIIGESLKRLLRFAGCTVYGDVHLGDWGLQMGIVISGLIEKFGLDALSTDEGRTQHIDIDILGVTYPQQAAIAKENEDVMAECKRITKELQSGSGVYFDIWTKVLEVSVADLKKNYARLGVEFDLWMGESDVRDVMPAMIEELKKSGLAHMDDGALVIDITREEDNPPLPPFILEKSDGAVLYSTTDLATILDRKNRFKPDHIIYTVDNRQGTHFKQLFRAAEITGIGEGIKLTFSGFGTMNGKDGKPYKTREGGIMRLEELIGILEKEAYNKIEGNIEGATEDELKSIAKKVGTGALKFADLSNHRSKDYIFDIDKFCSFEGKTGPYIQYSAVRIASILAKATDNADGKILLPEGDVQRYLMLTLTEFPYAIDGAVNDLAPNILADYIYQLAAAINKYYHEYKVVSEEDTEKRVSRIATLALCLKLLKALLDIIGIEIPEKM